MPDFVQVTTTTDSRDAAQAIASVVVEQRLAACCQVVGPISSTYRWEGAVEAAEEWLCLIKTSAEHFPALEAIIGQMHTYDVPEIVATPIVSGSNAYLVWLADALRPPTPHADEAEQADQLRALDEEDIDGPEV